MGNEGKRKEMKEFHLQFYIYLESFSKIRQTNLGELFLAVLGFFCTKSTSAKERGFILLKYLFCLKIFWTPVIDQQMNTRSTRWRGSEFEKLLHWIFSSWCVNRNWFNMEVCIWDGMVGRVRGQVSFFILLDANSIFSEECIHRRMTFLIYMVLFFQSTRLYY